MTFELNEAQARAASALESDVVVTAGAGSGKTRMLTQRFINAVVPGRVEGWAPAAVDEILAITFTERAAGELGERVRLTLREEGLVDEARQVDGAWVSTIHGLCSRLLRRRAFEANVDPLFEVADTVVAGRIRADAFERVAVSLVERNADVAALLDAYSYDRVFSAVVTLARELGVRGVMPSDVETEPAVPGDVLAEDAAGLFADGSAACGEYRGTASSPANHSAACSQLLERVVELRETAPDERALVEGLAVIVGSYKPLRAVRGLEAVREDGITHGTALKGRVGAAFVAPYARGLLALTEAFSAEFAEAKRDEGVLDFDDLQTQVVRLLTCEPAVAAHYRERFRLVMIDEFQDTDALQLRLVEALSKDNLCTVGDEKQSIYRFRGADIGVYREHREQMSRRSAAEVSLGVNYRSHEGVLAFVNAVFSAESYFAGDLLRLTTPEAGREVQPIDACLGDRPRVEALFVDCGAVGGPAGRRAEAREIAKRFAKLRAEGVDPSDMVILVRAYTNAHVYADALTAEGVPAVVVGGSRFFGLAEVAIMRALTRAIANPTDGSAIGELLASEFCALSDNGLARLRLTPEGSDTRPLWSTLCDGAAELDEEDAEAVRRLVGLIGDARRDVGTRPLADLLLQAVEDSGYDLRLLSRGNVGRDAFANVLKFARQAAAFEAREGTGPAGFSAYVDAKERLGDVEAPASVADDGSSAVRIMSVHASKGLEFPVVAVVDLASSGRNDSAIVRIGTASTGIRIALVPPAADDAERAPESAWAADFGEAERLASAEESDRVLYVAFTRARDLLIASGSMNMRPKNRPAATHHLMRLADLLGVDVPIAEAGERIAALADALTGQEASCGVRIVEAEPALARDAAAASCAPVASPSLPAPGPRIGPAGAAALLPERVSFSSMHIFEQCPRRFLAERLLGFSAIQIVEPGASGPARFGSAMHAALQLVKRDGSPPEEPRVVALGRQFELDESELERLRRAIARFLASPTVGRAIAHERVARELPFALPISGGACVLTGTIDLYACTGGDALIIDYKSGTAGESDALEARYRLQAECYALAAMVDGRESVEVVFVRPEVPGPDGGVQERRFRFEASDEPRLRAGIERRHGEIAASPYEPLSRRSEAICGGCAAPLGVCPNASP